MAHKKRKLMNLTLKKAEKSDIQIIKSILEENSLPNEDINTEIMDLFLINEESNLIGTIGLERFKNVALLRSMAIIEEYRNKGYGKVVFSRILEIAKAYKIEEIYILTCSAKNFFINLGFKEIERDLAPENIKSSNQFANLCPQSASFLKFKLI